MRLFLFDVDGTLITARGAGSRAMGRALRAVFGATGPIEQYDFSGKTDPQIVTDLMTAAGLYPAEITTRLPAFFERYVELLGEEIGDGSGVKLMPGMDELVRRLADYPRAVVGLLTGNIEAGARVKLTPTGLWEYFRVGAYGSDDAERTRLPAVAARRAEALLGEPIPPREVVVIGDTPLDIGCARAFGGVAVAVATGRHSTDALAALEPDLLFPNFADVPGVLGALLDGRLPR
jgi:phosphoglycolate phosphatase-like HAD superfamily hydrolase